MNDKESTAERAEPEVTATSASKAEPSTESQVRSTDERWERELISRVTFAGIREQRRTRRWGIFFKTLTFAYLGLVLYLAFPMEESSLTVGKKHTAVVEINGVIASDAQANAEEIIAGLRAAFKDKNTVGVILSINSPGGSPVQAGYVNDEIKRLKSLHPKIPIYAVVSDICASGGYYIAVAADKIYADKASLVGSIGVLMDGFGFVNTLEKLGVERRLMTAGENKGFLDPFSPVKQSDLDHVHTLLTATHQQFINVVKEGRGDRLKNDDKLFSGLIWTGEQSLTLGLIDGLGSDSYVAREVVGEENIVNFTHKQSPLERFAERIGAAAANVTMKTLGFLPQYHLE